jgi:hypothetical protein
MRLRRCVCVCLSLYPPIVVRQRLDKIPLIVARQRLGKNSPIFARQRLCRNVTAVTSSSQNVLLWVLLNLWLVLQDTLSLWLLFTLSYNYLWLKLRSIIVAFWNMTPCSPATLEGAYCFHILLSRGRKQYVPSKHWCLNSTLTRYKIHWSTRTEVWVPVARFSVTGDSSISSSLFSLRKKGGSLFVIVNWKAIILRSIVVMSFHKKAIIH